MNLVRTMLIIGTVLWNCSEMVVYWPGLEAFSWLSLDSWLWWFTIGVGYPIGGQSAIERWGA